MVGNDDLPAGAHQSSSHQVSVSTEEELITTPTPVQPAHEVMDDGPRVEDDTVSALLRLGDQATREESIAPVQRNDDRQCTWQSMYAEFWNNGYTVVDSGLDHSVLDTVAEDAKKNTKFDSIFLEIGEDVTSRDTKFDPHRFQLKVGALKKENTKAAIKTIQEQLELIASNMCSSWIVRRMTVLKSTAGGEEQCVHRDYSNMETLEGLRHLHVVQGGVLLAIEDHTKFVVYRKAISRLPDKKTRLVLSIDKGRCLFFRGDLAHSGAAYDRTHVRIHCYLDLPEPILRVEDATEAVAFKEYMCIYCNKLFDDKRANKKHMRTCVQETCGSRATSSR